jgi:hypothetical protein
VVAEAREEVEVDAIDRKTNQLDLSLVQGFYELVDGTGALLWGQVDGVALHQVFGFVMALVVVLLGRIPVITLHVLAMIARWKTPRITG